MTRIAAVGDIHVGADTVGQVAEDLRQNRFDRHLQKLRRVFRDRDRQSEVGQMRGLRTAAGRNAGEDESYCRIARDLHVVDRSRDAAPRGVGVAPDVGRRNSFGRLGERFDAAGRTVEAVGVEPTVHVVGARPDACRRLPPVLPGHVVGVAAQRAGAVAGRQRHRLVPEEQRGPPAGLPHGRPPALVGERAGDPSPDLPGPGQLAGRPVDRAPVAEEQAPLVDGHDRPRGRHPVGCRAQSGSSGRGRMRSSSVRPSNSPAT